MYAGRLATLEEIIVIKSPDSEDAMETLRSWTDNRGIELKAVDVGDDIDDVYDPTKETLGVTLGGDGTFLEGVRAFSPLDVPFLGVNTGTLAFLAPVSPDDLWDALSEVYRGEATIDTRQQLQVEADGVETTGINDVMVQHVPPENPVDRKVTRLEVFVDGDFVGEYDGTGIAVSTPTGSTGISLSARGPIHYPKNNNSLQIVPLHTHRMGVRPLVVDASTEISVVATEDAHMLVDGGRVDALLEKDDVVTITGSEAVAKIVTTSYDDDFFTSISEKLGWGAREDRNHTGNVNLVRATSDEPDEDDIEEHARQVAMRAARSAGEPLRELHGQVESIQFKTDKSDIVTEADFKAENIITMIIENEFPSHGIRSEESVERDGDSEYTWLIDPLDGTGNFAHGNPDYAVSIALLRGEEPVMGVVYAPETDDMFSATTEAAYKDDHTITVTDEDQLDESMLLAGYDPDGTFLAHYYQETRGIRSLGAAALHLAYLAAGSADATWEYDTYPWDVAAGIDIARAAGARLTDSAGNDYDLTLDKDEDERKELLGSNGALHDNLLEHLRSHKVLENGVDQ